MAGWSSQIVHVASAFLQEASVNAADCDVHFEISMTADKSAPRVIVETPVDSEFCSSPERPNPSWRNINSCWTLSLAANCHSPCQWMSWGWP